MAAKPNVKAVKTEPAKGQKPEGDAEAPPPKKGLGKTLMIVAVVLLILGAAGGGWYFFVGRNAANAEAAAKPEPPPKPVFLALDPFTVNLVEDSGDHYLQAAIVFQVKDEHTGEGIKVYMPILRDRILRLLSSKKPSELTPLEGKQKLTEQIMAEARASLPGDTPDKGLINTYFSSFVIQ